MTNGAMDNFQEYYARLIFNYEMGSDEALGDEIIPRIAHQTREIPDITDIAHANIVKQGANPIAPKPITLGDFEAKQQAINLIKDINSISDLKIAIDNFHGCALKDTANHTICFEDGGDLLIIGEYPSSEEDRHGKIFMGEDGILLDNALHALGLQRHIHASLGYGVFWRTPGERPPMDSEIQICQEFIKKYCALKQPKAILLLGNIATKAILSVENSAANRKKIWHFASGDEQCPCFIGLSLNNYRKYPQEKRKLYENLLELRQYL